MQGKRNASLDPPSPTFTETTNASAVNLGENGPAKIITRSDLKASMQSYENVSLLLSPPLRSGTGKRGERKKKGSYVLLSFSQHALALEFMF
jgi:hypothetical protein